ncbi:hypothetical protein MTP10_21050 [Nonomuraea sp. 3-1Str]|uniref:hypothetical protein n=1 Tax=Nonomuraea sp. 3-1Str TaxID=2929801 RepID=UPI0028666806|nr:hypothetical protein [Nonomuraea sp. 3-1Str]MDR8411209.1 hypothetical protein [Nonomuraea sp. 3-1Str]
MTAATSIYPWAAQIGPHGGPSDPSGLAWLTPSDARALASPGLPVTTALDLKLRDPPPPGPSSTPTTSPPPG